jgi:hypothetical protein
MTGFSATRPSDDRLIEPNEVFDRDVAEFEVSRAAFLHQAEGDGGAVVSDLDYLVGGLRVLALDQIAVLRRACGKVELRKRRLQLAFGSHLRSVTLRFVVEPGELLDGEGEFDRARSTLGEAHFHDVDGL